MTGHHHIPDLPLPIRSPGGVRGLLPDFAIEWYARERDMIVPFESSLVRQVERDGLPTPVKIISKGLASFGYDVSLKPQCKIFTNVNTAYIDPKNFDERSLVDIDFKVDEHGSQFVWLPPHSYLLGCTNETFKIPNDVLVICLGKSTYARCGSIVNVTPIEPGFEGEVVIEISNSTSLPVKIYANEGIAQFVFWRAEQECDKPYSKDRKYQGQTGITLPKA